jgi:signal transduction histidine kinase
MHKDHFHELEQLNPDFIQKLIGYMTTRARVFATKQLQHEKVNALGKLAAGVAHELNNPAAAINRISDELAKRLSRNYKLTEQLLQNKITLQQMQYISRIVAEKENGAIQKIKLTTMQRMDNEEEIAEWLKKNGVTENREQAETFSENGFTVAELEDTGNDIGKDAFISLLPWLENLLSSQKIIKDLDDASCRISNLVGAIKSHVQMDRTEDMQPTNIHTDIENTLTLLGFKLREKNIVVKKIFCDDMVLVPAYIGELNQVWTNIIDNAIFALKKNGELTIETFCNPKNITVCIIDNGPGIPKEIMSRIFDPFFTTKKVGEGNGIGLDLVDRIIKHHNAEIKVNSVPGRTAFEICIPLEQKTTSNN